MNTLVAKLEELMQDPNAPDHVAEAIMGLSDDDARTSTIHALIRRLSDQLGRKGLACQMLHRLQQEQLGPAASLTVALLSLEYRTLEEWGYGVVRERLLESPEAASFTWTMIARTINDCRDARLFEMLLETLPPLTSHETIKALTSFLCDYPLLADGATVPIRALLQAAIDHVQYMPLGYTPLVLRGFDPSVLTDEAVTAVIETSFRPAASRQMAQDAAREARLVRDPEFSPALDREMVAMTERYHLLFILISAGARTSTGTAATRPLGRAEVARIIDYMERLLALVPPDGAWDVYTHLPHLIRAAVPCLSDDAIWPRLHALLCRMPRTEESICAPIWLEVAASWPEERWGAVETLFLDWLRAYGASALPHSPPTDTAAYRRQNAVCRALGLTAAPVAAAWLEGVPEGPIKTTYAEMIVLGRDLDFGIGDDLRLALTQSEKAEARRAAILLPEASRSSNIDTLKSPTR